MDNNVIKFYPWGPGHENTNPPLPAKKILPPTGKICHYSMEKGMKKK